MNIVFDLGGVVFNWQPDAMISRVFEDSETQDLVRAEILEHADWVELDRGTLVLDHAIDRGASRTGLPRQDIERLFNEVPRSLTPIQETIELIRSIWGSDNKLFILSNMQFASIAYLEKKHQIWEMFDGIVISCRIQKVKPEIEIYEHLLAVHQLNAIETVFIDDMSENLVAASSIGIQTIKFEDPFQCRQELVDLKCF
jgi:putative hydrolase of the HAD superfamily